MTGRRRRLAATALAVLLALTSTAGSATADEWRTSVLLAWRAR